MKSIPYKSNTTDVVIVGAGIGGLVAGIELVRSGLEVTILEQHFQVGGCCSSFRRKGFAFDAGTHIIGGIGNKRVPIGRYLHNLKLDLEYIKFDPMDLIHFQNKTFEVPAEWDGFIFKLKRLFPKESKNIDIFFKEMVRMYRHFSNTKEGILERYADMTYQQILDHFFSESGLKKLLGAQWGYLGLQPNEISAIAMCSMLSSYLYCGSYFPKGGSGAFGNALKKKFIDLGGRIQVSKKVKKIILKSGKVESVIFGNDEELRTTFVISNCDAKYTFFQLIGRELVDPDYLKRIQSMKESISFFIVYLGVNIRREELTKKYGWFYEMHDLNSPQNLPLFITTPSLLDPDLAPQGMNTIEIYTKMPEREGKYPSYAEMKEEMEKEIISKAGAIIPRLSERIIVKESASSHTIQRYTLNANGAVYGWAAIPGQMWKNCLPNHTPIENLYLAGHWSFPGAGVMAVFISGLSAARRIISAIT